MAEAPDALGAFVRDGTFTRNTAICLERLLEAAGQPESPLAALETRVGLECLSEADLVVVATNTPDPELIRPDMVRAAAWCAVPRCRAISGPVSSTRPRGPRL